MKKGVYVFIFILCIFLPLFAWGELDTFAIIADTHIGTTDSVYAEFIEIMEKQNIKDIIHLGDAIHNPGKKREWEKFFEITGRDKKIYITPGNHDINDSWSMKVFLKYFPNLYYSISDNDTQFIFLNSEIPEEKGKISGEQLEWLKKELTKNFKFKFVFVHRPLFPVFANHGLDRFKKERDTLHKLFEKSGVSMVVSGHDHFYQRTVKDGMTYIICAGAGGQERFFAFNDTRFYFRYIVAKRIKNGYEFVVKDLNGDTGDEFQIIKE